jgi:hypothetical protein
MVRNVCVVQNSAKQTSVGGAVRFKGGGGGGGAKGRGSEYGHVIKVSSLNF